MGIFWWFLFCFVFRLFCFLFVIVLQSYFSHLILTALYHNATIRSHFITYCRTRVGYLEYLINRWVRLFIYLTFYNDKVHRMLIAKNSGYLLILMSNVSRAVLEINGHQLTTHHYLRSK